MSVVGFDIGNENCVVAIARQRGIDVLLNEESNRETPAVVSFGEKQRYLGPAGVACASMNPKSTISQVKRLIGRQFMDHEVQNELRTLPFESSEDKDGGILILVPYMGGKQQSFTPVQILAMIFSHLRQISEKNVGFCITRCVIGVPSYFTDLQRRCYLNAATIAGLSPLRLMHECTATALGYGIYKSDLFSQGSNYVVFVDVGHSDTQVSVVCFESGKMEVLSHAFDMNLGGRDFDEVLFNHFSSEFKDQYHIDVRYNVRASIRLRASCEKLKKVLSANAEASLNIECLMEEKDVKSFMKREEFEKLSDDLLQRILSPCKKALFDSRLKVHDIQSVELVGSGSRMPAITTVLASFFGREPSRTLNASECVARGCAIQCAMLSPEFRVTNYEVVDSFPFSVGFVSEHGPVSTSPSPFFPKHHTFPTCKMLTLYRDKTFCLEALYTETDDFPVGESYKITSFLIGRFPVFVQEKSKVKVLVQLDLHGIVRIVSATLIVDHVDEPGTSGQRYAYVHEHLPSTNINVSEDSDIWSGNATTEYTDGWRKNSKRWHVPVSETVHGGMTISDLKEAVGKEAQLIQQDRMIEQAKEKKNTLESYIYETRNNLLDVYWVFCTDSEREDISRSLQQMEEWLYEGDVETVDVYSEKFEIIRKLVDPVEKRYKDEEARAKSARFLPKDIVEYPISIEKLPNVEEEMTDEWRKNATILHVPVSENVHGGMTTSDLKETVGKEAQLIQQDMMMEQAKEKKYTLESYIHETRNNVDSVEKRYKDEEDRAQATRLIPKDIVEYPIGFEKLPNLEEEGQRNSATGEKGGAQDEEDDDEGGKPESMELD